VINDRFTLRAHRAFQWGDWIGIYGFSVDREHRHKHEARNLTMEPIADEGQAQEPFVRLDREAAQELMDDLWQCGVRPAGAAGSVGQLDATRKHLADIRAIAFAKLEIEPPK
jgi:hypothetical protein